MGSGAATAAPSSQMPSLSGGFGSSASSTGGSFPLLGQSSAAKQSTVVATSASTGMQSFGQPSLTGASSAGTSGAFPSFSLSSASTSSTSAPLLISTASTSSATATASTSSTPLSGFAGVTASSAAQVSSAATAGTTSGKTGSAVIASSLRTPQIPSEITGKTVEEIIKDWNSELQERTTKFRKQAEALAEWDRRILRNRNVLIKLESEVAKVVESQHSLERQLELIETHQQQVEKALQSMEEEAERIYKEERPSITEDEAASVRDLMYEQAEYIEREMEQMGEQIKRIIETVNANQGGDLDNSDGISPLDIVVRILNNQLNSLVWIDEKAGELSSRINKLADHGAALDRGPPRSRHWIG